MRLFSLMAAKFDHMQAVISNYLAQTLSNFKTQYGTNTVFGQLINVIGGVTQNVLAYMEDALTEQNKYTATRKKSIYSLAQVSGYNPSLGSATTLTVRLNWLPNTDNSMMLVIPNHTQIVCAQNNMVYNIILPQENIIWSPNMDNGYKFLSAVEGRFETQSFVASGGELYSENIKFVGDIDLDYLEVFVNDVPYERAESLYDMRPEGEQFMVRTGLKKGIDLVFGNGQFGKAIKWGDVIKVTYLLHSGEYGGIDPNADIEMTFKDSLYDVTGTPVKPADVLNMIVSDPYSINTGTFADDMEQVRHMIGANSRSLILVTPQSYEIFFNKFSFIGYHKTWSEPGSLLVNGLLLKNYKNITKEGKDYFSLREEDFILNDAQKHSLLSSIENSGRQLAGVTFNINDPVLCKYAAFLYIKLKNPSLDTTAIKDKIRNLIGEFFSDLNNDDYVPKSDIAHLIKTNIPEVDGVNIYFISERNEIALQTHTYEDEEYIYDPSQGTYKITTVNRWLYGDENPNIGFDDHGNISLKGKNQFPVLMGGWRYVNSDNQLVDVIDPLMIVFE